MKNLDDQKTSQVDLTILLGMAKEGTLSKNQVIKVIERAIELERLNQALEDEFTDALRYGIVT